MLLSLTTAVALGLSLASGMTITTSPEHSLKDAPNPLPYCEKCLTKAQIEAPGVGLDLSITYGTAAVRYHNGSTIGVTKVEGSDDYISMMRRFSSNKAPCTGNLNRFQQALCDIARKKRQLNKSLGLPATADVLILSKMLTSLAAAVSADHDIPVAGFRIATPRLQGYTNEDVIDALEYAHLTAISPYMWPTSELPAAFAASGGMCKNWTRVWDCMQEERALKPSTEVLAVGYTDLAMSIAMSTRGQALYYQNPDTIHWDLGKYSKEGKFPTENSYWQVVKTRIQELPRTSGWPVETILVLGEDGKDGKFLNVLKDALTDIQGEGTFEIVSESDLILEGKFEPLYLAAKGMALSAKRMQETQPYCEESELCRKHRLPGVFQDQTVLSDM